jgi:hypothetical protein
LVHSPPPPPAGQADLNDPALIVGATFADPVSGVRVTTLEAAGGRARVAVDLPLPTPGVNHAPEAVDDSGSTAKGTAVEIAVLANDVDADGDSLSVTEAAQPAHGSVRVLPDGRLQYQPQRRFTGTETFAYTVTDGVDSATAIVTVTVSGDDPGGGNGNAKGGGKGKNP